MEEKKNKNPGAAVFPSPRGNGKRTIFVWNDDKTALVPTGEVDIQKEIDERAKGMSITEQIARAMRGDVSVFQDGEAFYGDVSNVPASDIDSLNVEVNARSQLEQAALDNNMTIEELEERLNEYKKEIEILKKQKESAPAQKQEAPEGQQEAE